MTSRYRLLTVVVLAGLLVALAAPVAALAQGPGSGGSGNAPTPRGGGRPGPGHGRHHGAGWGQNATFDAFATALEMTPAELVAWIEAGHTIAELVPDEASRTALIDSVVERLTAWMEECVGAGHMDAEQQAWMEEHLRWRIDWLIDNPEALLYEWHHGPTYGAGWGHGFQGLVWAAAHVLNLNPWDIRDALHEGQTIAELAGHDPAVIDEIVRVFMEPRSEALDAAVAAGQLSQAQADWLEAEIEEYARWLIENTPPMGEFGHGHGGRGCH